jgi:hypothetical protein
MKIIKTIKDLVAARVEQRERKAAELKQKQGAENNVIAEISNLHGLWKEKESKLALAKKYLPDGKPRSEAQFNDWYGEPSSMHFVNNINRRGPGVVRELSGGRYEWYVNDCSVYVETYQNGQNEIEGIKGRLRQIRADYPELFAVHAAETGHNIELDAEVGASGQDTHEGREVYVAEDGSGFRSSDESVRFRR